MTEPDELLEMQYEEQQAPTLDEDHYDDEWELNPDWQQPEECSAGCHQGSHAEDCEWYAATYEAKP